MTNELEQRYGFAAELAARPDDELVDRFNAQVGNRGWGTARMYYTLCLRAELVRRPIDASAITSDAGLRMKSKATLFDSKIVVQEQQTDEDSQP